MVGLAVDAIAHLFPVMEAEVVAELIISRPSQSAAGKLIPF